MRLLLDECVPRKLKAELKGHDVRTVQEMGWSGVQNGQLLTLIRQSGFEAFLTVDQNLAFQQDVASSGVAVIVLAARSNRLKHLLLLVPEVLERLSSVRQGQVVRIGS